MANRLSGQIFGASVHPNNKQGGDVMRVFIALFIIAAFFAPSSTQAQTPQSLDSAVVAGARYLQGRFPRGTRAAIVAVQGENRAADGGR